MTGVALRFIDRDGVRALLPYEACIEVVARAMRVTSAGGVHLPLRQQMPLPTGAGALGMMPGYLGDPASFGIKLVSLFPGNAGRGRSTHLGLYVLYDADTGEPRAILDAGELTARRTAAASAVASRALMRPDSRRLAILGTGEQAEAHVRAFSTLRCFDTVVIWGRDTERARSLVTRMSDIGDLRLEVARSIEHAVASADVVCTVTAATDPILAGEWVRPGTHLCLVGSSFPNRREVDDDCVAMSRVFVDYRASALAQAGEILHAEQSGRVTRDHILGEIGEVLAGTCPGRVRSADVTLYKSLGIAAQDLAAAMHVWRESEACGYGTIVKM